MGNKTSGSSAPSASKQEQIDAFAESIHGYLEQLDFSKKKEYDKFGTHLFKGATAAPYMKKHGLSVSVLDSHEWVTNGNIDKVNFTMIILIFFLKQ